MNKSLRSIYNLVLLDESGTMQRVKQVTLSGFNEMVQTIRAAQRQFPEQQHFVTLVTFNGTGIKTIFDKVQVDQLAELKEDDYQPQRLTPLYDAMAKSLLRLEFQTEGEEDCTVLVSILTDGEENFSKEFTGKNIKAIVKRLKEKGWLFTYIGANQDVEKVAAELDIESYVQYESTEPEMEDLFRRERQGRLGTYNKISEGFTGQEILNDFWKPE